MALSKLATEQLPAMDGRDIGYGAELADATSKLDTCTAKKLTWTSEWTLEAASEFSRRKQEVEEALSDLSARFQENHSNEGTKVKAAEDKMTELAERLGNS